jgi:TRAP-type uncharacterized transport system fused permease subunit
MRGLHLAFALVLAFLILPGAPARRRAVGRLGLVLVLAAAAALYPSANLTLHRQTGCTTSTTRGWPTTSSAAR